MIGDTPMYAAGQVAIQTLLSVLINLHIAEYDDREKVREEITKSAADIIF
jgi:hypothetical protein